jgi:hypothetical protein
MKQFHVVYRIGHIPQGTKGLLVSSQGAAKNIVAKQDYSEGWYYRRDSLHQFLFVRRNEWDKIHAK